MKNSHLKAVIVLTACLLIAASAVAQLAINTTGNEFATTQSQSGANGKTAPGAVQMCLNAQGVAIPADAAGVNCKGGGGASSNFGSTFPTSGTAIGFTDGTNMVSGKVRTPGSSATIADPAVVVVDPNVQAAVAAATIALGPVPAASSVPMTVGPALLGSYCMGANTGTIAAGLAAGSPIYSFRYGGANLAIVRKVVTEADDITTAFAIGTAKLDMVAARLFTASDTGGTAATLTGNNGKLRTSFATTAVSDLRISSTAALAAGTRTLDAQPLASIAFEVGGGATANTVLLPTTELYKSAIGESPFVLAANEGFVVQATVPATGTWFASVRVCWDEVSAF